MISKTSLGKLKLLPNLQNATALNGTAQEQFAAAAHRSMEAAHAHAQMLHLVHPKEAAQTNKQQVEVEVDPEEVVPVEVVPVEVVPLTQVVMFSQHQHQPQHQLRLQLQHQVNDEVVNKKFPDSKFNRS